MFILAFVGLLFNRSGFKKQIENEDTDAIVRRDPRTVSILSYTQGDF